MATGLLGGVLPYIYSRADALKRTLGDVVSNPMASAEQVVNNANDRARYLNQLQAQVASQGVKGLTSPQGQELANLYTQAYNPVGITTKSVSNNFNVVKRDASDIFGAGSERVRYTEPKSGGSIEVLSKPDGSASILSLEVPEKFRGKKIGESLQAQVMQDFPEFGGQFSSKAAAKGAYRLGLRPLSQPNATFDDVLKMIDENSSVNMITPQMQRRFIQPLPTTQEATFTDPFANTIGSSIR